MTKAGLAAVGVAVSAMVLFAGAARAAEPAGGPPSTAPIVARAEQCLSRNVERVVAADPGLESAADFLMTYACAAEVSGAARYERNVQALRMVSEMFKGIGRTAALAAGAGKPSIPTFEVEASVDPETGEIIYPEPKAGATPSPISLIAPTMSSLTQIWPEVKPVRLRKLAGELVLAARERQLARPR